MFKYLLLVLSFVLVFSDVSARKSHRHNKHTNTEQPDKSGEGKKDHNKKHKGHGKKHGGKGKHHGGNKKHYQPEDSNEK